MDDLDYLAVDFDPNSLTVPRLRSILVAHDVSYPSSAKKPDLVNLFNDEIAPQAKKILSARSRTKRTSKGITNVEHDISAALPPDEGEQLRPLSVIREPGRRRKSPRPIVNQPDVVETTNAPKHARQPAQESISANVNKIDVHSVSQKQPRHKVTSDAHRQTLPPKPTEETLLRHARASDSPFSSDNPFQSGSSPLSNSGLVENEKRRQTTGVLEKSNKDAVFNRRRRTDDYTSDKQNRAARADHASLLRPTRQTQKLEDQDHGILSVGEEFTPEEEAELARDDGDISARLALTSTRSENARGTANVAKTAPWAVILAFILGFAAVWRQEKLDIGYCGVAQQLDLVRPVRIPEWASTLQPQCEPCPQHAFCYPGLKTLCEPGFVLKPHPLSVGGVVPLPPSCEPDTDRERRVHAVADRAIEYLREINAQWECGELRDESGKLLPSSAVKEEDLRREVSTKKRRDMTEAEFEELWNTAVGDIRGRDEVVVETEA